MRVEVKEYGVEMIRVSGSEMVTYRYVRIVYLSVLVLAWQIIVLMKDI
jgi:hypothetical protein